MRLVYLALEKGKNKHFEKYNVTSSQGDVLFFLYCNKENQSINQKYIEEHLHLANPTVTGILKRLEEKGFIKRIKSKKDARNKIIKLTQLSYDFFEEVLKLKTDVEKMMLSGMDEEEKKQFLILLNKVFENIVQC
ncbi:MarR family multiple gene transcriptional regulator MgrA [Natranaerovirga hydrolytica]|uniref:MarR family multiple gene transcriptional regulator MgrA n=2 Tax=Natranaerovirga hydrolytica TaxID=680378 RepID=A0A4R1MDB2_9FIRM|nr:MarR family multiple gene transcriptional regulator MgrA [Natranaerovirga hydrolytica]